MNSRTIVTAAVSVSLLMANALSAQEISTAPAEGEKLVDVGDGLAAPETPMLVLHVPVSLQALATGVGAVVYCEVVVNLPDSTNKRSVFRKRRVPVTDRAYQGVVSFYFQETWSPKYNTGYRAEDLDRYICRLLLCANGVHSNSHPENSGVSSSCARPDVSRSDLIRHDPDAPYRFFVQGNLQPD